MLQAGQDVSISEPEPTMVRIGSERQIEERWIQEPGRKLMKNIKFVVKVNRGGAHAPQYVLRVDRLPIQTTTNRKLALVMGRFTAEDAVKSMQNSHCVPELVSVRVSA
jgi:hypothetical protein